MRKNKKGFTLIELLVVVAIIGILAGLLIPGLMKRTVDAKIKTANGNANTVYNTVSNWLQDEIIRDKDHSNKTITNATAETTLKDELGKLKDTAFYVKIDDKGDVEFVLWGKKGTTVGTTQLTEEGVEKEKGKIGCHPLKEEDAAATT